LLPTVCGCESVNAVLFNKSAAAAHVKQRVTDHSRRRGGEAEGMAVIKRVSGLPLRFGGVEHSGWLPSGAATPLPTPIKDVVLDVHIEAIDAGFLLIWESRDGSEFADTWHQSLEHAEEYAKTELGISRDQWVPVDLPSR